MPLARPLDLAGLVHQFEAPFHPEGAVRVHFNPAGAGGPERSRRKITDPVLVAEMAAPVGAIAEGLARRGAAATQGDEPVLAPGAGRTPGLRGPPP